MRKLSLIFFLAGLGFGIFSAFIINVQAKVVTTTFVNGVTEVTSSHPFGAWAAISTGIIAATCFVCSTILYKSEETKR